MGNSVDGAGDQQDASANKRITGGAEVLVWAFESADEKRKVPWEETGHG
jgi:hypothetical protein